MNVLENRVLYGWSDEVEVVRSQGSGVSGQGSGVSTRLELPTLPRHRHPTVICAFYHTINILLMKCADTFNIRARRPPPGRPALPLRFRLSSIRVTFGLLGFLMGIGFFILLRDSRYMGCIGNRVLQVSSGWPDAIDLSRRSFGPFGFVTRVRNLTRSRDVKQVRSMKLKERSKSSREPPPPITCKESFVNY